MQSLHQQKWLQNGEIRLSTLLLLLALFVTGLFSGIILFNAFSSRHAGNQLTGNQLTTAHPGKANNKNGTNINSPFRPLSATAQVEKNHAAILTLRQEVQQLNKRIHTLKKEFFSHGKNLPGKTVKTSRQSSTSIPLPNNFPTYTLDTLIQGGVNVTVANDIIQKQSDVELKRLDLQDRAKREGYYMTTRYKKELAKIDARAVNLRNALGDSDYDRFLYKSHLNNRVKVMSVMPGSAAEQAGIQKNDIILDYNDARIFNWNELKKATAGGNRNEQVTIDVSRNGELFSLIIPRGPLGIRLGATRVAPQQ